MRKGFSEEVPMFLEFLKGLPILILLIGIEGSAFGYEEAPVTNGGRIMGKVFLNGTPPPARIYHLVFSPNKEFCGKISDGKGNRLLREFRVADGGGFADVVVAVVGVERGKPFDYIPRIEIENCRIGPFVTPVRNGHPFEMVNKDPVVHDVQGYTLRDPYAFAMFNKPLVPESRAEKPIRLRKDHYLFRTQCGVHDFMQSWGLAVGNPYFAVTGTDGSFFIEDLPPGEYDVIAWHPHLQVLAQRVRVPATGEAGLNFVFDSSEVDIPLHDLQTGYRLQTALDVQPIPVPTLERQTP
jgi:hypothetical protein